MDSDPHFVAQAGTHGLHGTFSIDANGVWTYTADSAFNELNTTDTLTDNFSVSAIDGTRTTVTVNIKGSNDGPVAAAAVNSVAEDATISGSVTGTDADAGETATLTFALVGSPPTGLTFHSDGSYTFDASSYNSLKDGEPLVLTIPFTATDENAATSTPANLVITITGTNDTPVASAAVAAVDEDASIYGSVSGTDADAGETATLTFALVGSPPTGLTLHSDGSYTFDASSYNSLNDDEPLVLTIPFTATDENGAVSAPANLVITINGTNDTPVATAAVNSVAEDATIYGSVTGTDADAGETATLTFALVGSPPTGLTFHSDGSYTFDASSYDSLKDGEPLVLTIPFTATDEKAATSTPANLVITIKGTNDAPVADADGPYTATEDTALIVTNANGVLFGDTDVDGNALTAQLVSTTAHGTLALNPDGSFTYTPAANFNGTDSFVYRASDGTLTSSNVTVAINVAGTNDAPINTVPTANQHVADDHSSLIFSTSNGNAISVFDSDAGDADIRVTLTVKHGILNVDPNTVGVAIDGNATATVTLTGSQSDINAALEGLNYTSNSQGHDEGDNEGHNDQLIITTSDLGNSGAGGPLTDTDKITIEIGEDHHSSSTIVSASLSSLSPSTTFTGLGSTVEVIDLSSPTYANITTVAFGADVALGSKYAVDILSYFDGAANRIDVSDILASVGAHVSNGNVGNYVTAVQQSDGSVAVSVDADGKGSNAPVQIATITGTAGADHHALGTSAGDVIAVVFDHAQLGSSRWRSPDPCKGGSQPCCARSVAASVWRGWSVSACS